MSTLKVSEYKKKKSWANGMESEERWLRIHPEAEKTDYKTDRYRHVDFWHGPNQTEGVDVKGNKPPEAICLEFKNVAGEKGWMHGDAKFIAVEILGFTGFFRFDREECLNWCRAFVSKEHVSKYSLCHHKLYTRSKWGKKDVVTSVTIHDLADLATLTYIPWDEEDIVKAGGAKTSVEYNHPTTGEVMVFGVP